MCLYCFRHYSLCVTGEFYIGSTVVLLSLLYKGENLGFERSSDLPKVSGNGGVRIVTLVGLDAKPHFLSTLTHHTHTMRVCIPGLAWICYYVASVSLSFCFGLELL